MITRLCITAAAFGLVFAGCRRGDGPIIDVTASYPGADAMLVADTVASPIEQQINGVERLVRIESESYNDGRYVAHLRFAADADRDLTLRLVQNRVNLAAPLLPQEVQRTGVSVRLGVAKAEGKSVSIALVDREDRGREELQRLSAAVVKRLVAEGVAVSPNVFPGADEPRVELRIDRAKCAVVGVKEAVVRETVRAAGKDATLDQLKSLTMTSTNGEKIPLGSLVSFNKLTAPAALYRCNLYPAVRLNGLPPEGRTLAEAAAGWVKVAEAGLPRGFEVENLNAR
jgi:multidrug efflux pump subunit AcrB